MHVINGLRYLVLVVLLSVLLCVDQSLQEEVPPCTIVKTRQVQQEFSECSRRYGDEFHNSGDGGDVCQLLRNIVEECVQVFSQCHTAREIRRMQDLHIEALIGQYKQYGDLDNCPVVKEYRESGRNEAEEEDVLCNDDRTVAVQTDFQNCIHSTSTVAYQAILDLDDNKIISDKLCKAMSTIGTVCVKHLSECFADDDLSQMRRSHIEEMKKFFLGFSDKVTSDALDNCKIMEYTENYEDDNSIDDKVAEIIPATTTVKEIIPATTTVKVPDTTTTEEIIQGKDSRSVETPDDNVDIDTYDSDDYYSNIEDILKGSDEEDAAPINAVSNDENNFSDNNINEVTEAAERLHYITSSATISSNNVIHTVITLVLLLYVTFL